MTNLIETAFAAMGELSLPLADDAVLVATKLGDAPIAGLWAVKIATGDHVEELGMATAADLTKLLRLRSPASLVIIPEIQKHSNCGLVLTFYGDLGPTATLYGLPTDSGIELAWTDRDKKKRTHWLCIDPASSSPPRPWTRGRSPSSAYRIVRPSG